MSREILFKGWCTHNEKWIEGDVIFQSKNTVIRRRSDAMCFEVDPSTVCQYTGLCSKDGQLIFEGDILEGRFDDKHPEDVTRVVVKWILFGWYLSQDDRTLPNEMDELDIDIWTVVGNIWDNPELLEGGTGE